MNPIKITTIIRKGQVDPAAVLAKAKPFLMLLLIMLVAYLPLSSLYFGMKNDAFSDNFPNKYFLSESLHSGMLPLWNPYMNFGFPVYADVGFAFWNPVTWLFALWGYNAYTLTIEVLLYIYLAGVSMYGLARLLQFGKKTALLVAAMYMCSGFFVGCLQYINFLTSAAFLPMLVWAYLSLLRQPELKRAVVLSMSAYMVFAGGHPAIPFATVYFLLIFSIVILVKCSPCPVDKKKILKNLVLSVGIFVMLALPAIYSYANILENYSRYSAQQDQVLIDTGFDPLSYLSFLFPLLTLNKQGFFTNDIAFRNGYISIIAIVALVAGLFVKNRLNLVFFISGVLMLILCAGGDFKQSLYGNLPLLNYVRTNGEYRVFPLLCFCVSAGYGLQGIFEDEKVRGLFLRLLVALGIILGLLFTATLVINFSYLMDYVTKLLHAEAGIAAVVKDFYDTSPLSLLLVKNVAFALILIIISIYALRKKNFVFFILCILSDLIVMTIAYLPATGIGQVTVDTINSYYKANPTGIIIPPLTPINKIDTFEEKTASLVGAAAYYNKYIGTLSLNDYPSYFRTTDEYFESTTADTVSRMPYVFLNSATRDCTQMKKVTVKYFSPTLIKLKLKPSNARDTLVLLQNDYKFWHAYVNGKPTPVIRLYHAFIAVAISNTTDAVVFSYEDPTLIWLVIFSIFIAVGCLIIVFRPGLKRDD